MARKQFWRLDKPISFCITVIANWHAHKGAYVGHARWESLDHTHHIELSYRPTEEVFVGTYTPRMRQPNRIDQQMQSQGIPPNAITYLQECFLKVVERTPKG